jgi:hypothetical protein
MFDPLVTKMREEEEQSRLLISLSLTKIGLVHNVYNKILCFGVLYLSTKAVRFIEKFTLKYHPGATIFPLTI